MQALFLRYAGISFDKQVALDEMLGDHSWDLDLKAGAITFSTGSLLRKKKHTFQIQVLGTESEEDHTWIWAWANDAVEIPRTLLKFSLGLKQWGARRKIKELSEGQFELGERTGHHVAMIASALCKADCYYRGGFETGAVYVLISDPAFTREDVTTPCVRVATVFSTLISALEIPDHHAALIAYLKEYGVEPQTDGASLIAKSEAGEELAAKFDGDRRIADLDVKVDGISLIK